MLINANTPNTIPAVHAVFLNGELIKYCRWVDDETGEIEYAKPSVKNANSKVLINGIWHDVVKEVGVVQIILAPGWVLVPNEGYCYFTKTNDLKDIPNDDRHSYPQICHSGG